MRLGRLATSVASGTLVMFSACTDLLTGPHAPRFENGRDDEIGEAIDAPAGFTGTIRIGVLAAINGSTPTTSVTIGSPTSFTVINKTTGATIAIGNAENITAVLIPGGTSSRTGVASTGGRSSGATRRFAT